MLYFLDGNNVCQMKRHKVVLQAILLTLCHELRRRGDDYVCYFDANIHYLIKEQGEKDYVKIALTGDKYQIVPGSSRADGFIVAAADNENACVISNDKYEELWEKFPWTHKMAKPQRVFKGMVTYSRNKEADMLLIPDLDINIPIEYDIQKLLPGLGVSPDYNRTQNYTDNIATSYPRLEVIDPPQQFVTSVSFKREPQKKPEVKVENKVHKQDTSNQGVWAAIIGFFLLISGLTYFITREPVAKTHEERLKQEGLRLHDINSPEQARPEATTPTQNKQEYVEPTYAEPTQNDIWEEVPIQETAKQSTEENDNQIRYKINDPPVSATSDNDQQPNTIQKLEPICINCPPSGGIASSQTNNGSSPNVIRTSGTISGRFEGDVTIESGVSVTLGADVIIKGNLIMKSGSSVNNLGLIKGNVHCENAHFTQTGGSLTGLIYNGSGY